MNKTVLAMAIATTMAGFSVTASAHSAGDWIVRGGLATVDPDESSSNVSAGGTEVADTKLGVSTDSQLGLTITYMVTDHFAVELLASTPFEHDVTLQGQGLSPTVPAGTTIATVEHLPPTLSAQYFFLDASSAIQPYVGIGLNYWLVMDEELSDAAKSAVGATSLDVDDSVGLSYQLGVDFSIGEHWLINAAVWNIDIDTEAEFYASALSADISADIDIDPWVYMIGVGYRF